MTPKKILSIAIFVIVAIPNSLREGLIIWGDVIVFCSLVGLTMWLITSE